MALKNEQKSNAMQVLDVKNVNHHYKLFRTFLMFVEEFFGVRKKQMIFYCPMFLTVAVSLDDNNKMETCLVSA